MDTVLYGPRSYYPEYMPYERTDEDIRADERKRHQCGAHRESTWGLWEPEDGRFEYAWMDRVVEKLHAAGIRIIMGTPTIFHSCMAI